MWEGKAKMRNLTWDTLKKGIRQQAKIESSIQTFFLSVWKMFMRENNGVILLKPACESF